jgi:hypothetical protein
MKVPDGEDYVELMLYHTLPSPDRWGTKNHLSRRLIHAPSSTKNASKERDPALPDMS